MQIEDKMLIGIQQLIPWQWL